MPKKFDFLSPGIQITEIDQSILPSDSIDEGPIIIGRTRKGPGMQPVRIKSMEDYVKVFGAPVPGGSSALGDVWRDGPNLSAPTYAAYAAQAWLASGNSPITVVRLLGDQADTATSGTDGEAGWQLSTAIATNVASTNSTAYGLFVVDSAKVGVLQWDEITLSGAGGADGDYLTITDSFGSDAVRFEWDNNDSVAESATVRKVTWTGATAATAANFVTAVNAAVTAGYLKGIVCDIKDSDTATFRIATTSTTATASIAESGDSGNLIDGGTTSWTLAVATTAIGTGALAAIIYVDSGYITLNGIVAGGSEIHSQAATFIKSNASGCGFKLDIYNSSGTLVEQKNFNFTRNSSDYIRNVLNTNPVLTSTAVTTSDNRKTYWLGESFERHLLTNVTTTGTGNQYGVLLPLQKSDNAAAKTGNWGCHKAKHSLAKSGWVLANDDGVATNFDALNATKLFRVESLHSGDDLQKEVMIQIDNIKVAPNPVVYPYGSFSLKVINTAGNALETYNECNLDPNSTNFVARRIGNQKMSWDDTNKKFNADYDHPNVSDYIRVEMFSETADNYNQSQVPFGFLGPGRPKSFMLISGSTVAHDALGGSQFSGVFVRGSGSVPHADTLGDDNAGNFFSSSVSHTAVKFEFPKIKLRADGTEGFVANPNKAVFGIRPKVSTTSNLHDSDFCDYLRALPSQYNTFHHTPTGDWEYSFAFTLDDIIINPTTKAVTYTSGSRQYSGTDKDSYSYTAASGGVSNLLAEKVKQFAMPLFGGRHGLDIKEMEPFRNSKMNAMGSTDNTNYLRYSIKKALDSCSDPEYVPANLLVVPGVYDTKITDKVIAVSEARQDILSIIDLEGDYVSIYESTESASSRRGDVSTTISNIKSRNIDSTFSCCFFPWVQITDKLSNNQRVWVPSSVAGIGAMAQSEAASAAWFAPAGFNRGGLGNLGGSSGPRVVQARSRVDSDERDRLYAEANINPIATFPNEGVVIFGQKTLQSGVDSALGRINVRRLLIYLKSKISTVAKNVLFDNNVRSTWARFRAKAEPILADVQARFGLTEYKLVLDETTTTPDLIDRNIMYAQVYLKPARAIEFIAIDFIITKSGAEFA